MSSELISINPINRVSVPSCDNNAVCSSPRIYFSCHVPSLALDRGLARVPPGLGLGGLGRLALGLRGAIPRQRHGRPQGRASGAVRSAGRRDRPGVQAADDSRTKAYSIYRSLVGSPLRPANSCSPANKRRGWSTRRRWRRCVRRKPPRRQLADTPRVLLAPGSQPDSGCRWHTHCG